MQNLPLQPQEAREEEGARDWETPGQIPQPLLAWAGRGRGPGGSQPFRGLNPHPHLLSFVVDPNRLTITCFFQISYFFLIHTHLWGAQPSSYPNHCILLPPQSERLEQPRSACVFSCARLSVTPWTGAHQGPLSVGFSRQEHWSGLPFPSPEDHPDPEMEPTNPPSPALAGWFFTTSTPREALEQSQVP